MGVRMWPNLVCMPTHLAQEPPLVNDLIASRLRFFIFCEVGSELGVHHLVAVVALSSLSKIMHASWSQGF